MASAVMDICVQMFVWTHIFISLGYIARRGVAGSCDNPLRKGRLFPMWLHRLPCHEQCVSVPVYIPPHRHLWFSTLFLIIKPGSFLRQFPELSEVVLEEISFQ